MKKLMFLFALLVIGLTGVAFADSIAVLSNPQGEVYVRTAGADEASWSPVTAETQLNTGDSVKTAAGTAVLTYTGQATFDLASNTSITITRQDATEDILLVLGNLKGKVDSHNAVRPFQVVTSVAVSAVRGTDVDFDFNEDGELTVDLHDGGPVQVYSDESGLDLNLGGVNRVTISFNEETGEITVSNSCDSDGSITFSLLGREYTVAACESQTVAVEGETAAGDNGTPGTGQGGQGGENNPNENTPSSTAPAASSVVTENVPV